jgi:nucleoside-diphosphate-sugar epimerase
MLKGQPIKVFNYGKMQRDFTYIDDIVQGVVGALMAPNLDPYEIINLGNHRAEELLKVARRPAPPAHLTGYFSHKDGAYDGFIRQDQD